MSTPDLTSIKAVASQTLVDSLNQYITGTNEDVQAFASGIMSDTIDAVAAGRTDLLPVLVEQTMMLAEMNRLEFVAGGLKLASTVTLALATLAVRIVIPTIPAVPLV